MNKLNIDKISKKAVSFALSNKKLVLEATAFAFSLVLIAFVATIVGKARAERREREILEKEALERSAEREEKIAMIRAVVEKLPPKTQKALRVDDIDTFISDTKSAAAFYRSSVRDGVSLLYLCDKKHALPQGYAPSDLVSLTSGSTYTVGRTGINLRRDAAVALDTMAAAAVKDGVKLSVNSAYRSYEYQKVVFNRWVQIDGEEEAERESSRPGTSQHQLGTAIDFGSIDESFYYTKECQWLTAHAQEYGWSLSFPDGYENETGYKWECWHFRYIGIPACRYQKKYFGDIQQFMLEFLDAWVNLYPPM